MVSISSVRRSLAGFDRQIWMLFTADIINVFGTSIIRTFLAIFMYEQMHMSMSEVGLALFVSSLAGALAAYAGGSIADAYGRKKVLVIGLAMQVAVYLLISLSIEMNVPFLLFVTVLTLSSLVQGLYQPVPDVMIADVVEPGRRVEAYGLIRIGANLGWVVGPVFGGLLLLMIPFAQVFYLVAFTTFIYLLIAIFELRETRSTVKTAKLRLDDIKVIVTDRPFLMYTIIAGLMLIPYQQMYTLLSVYSSDVVQLNDFWIGVLFALSGIMVVLFQYSITLWVRNYRLTSMLALAALVFAGGFSVLALSAAFVMPFICIAVATVGEMIWSPAGSTMQANLAPEDRRGRYFGFYGLASSLGFAVGPLAGGVLKDSLHNDQSLMWITVSLMFVACAVGYLLLNRVIPDKANAPRRPEKIKEKMIEVPLNA